MTALEHKDTDRVPIAVGFGVQSPEITRLQQYLKLDDPAQVWGWLFNFSDIGYCYESSDFIGPQNRGDAFNHTKPKRTDMFGIGTEAVSYGEGIDKGFYYEYTVSPLADMETIEELDAYTWPTTDWFDFSHTRERVLQASQGGTKAVQLSSPPSAQFMNHPGR